MLLFLQANPNEGQSQLIPLPQIEIDPAMTTKGRLAMSGFQELAQMSLPKGDIELRVWDGFGIVYPHCYIFRYHDGGWKAVYLPSVTAQSSPEERTKALPAPRSGWPIFWRRAGDLGIWWLPDQNRLLWKEREWLLDGHLMLVEIKRNGQYRSYSYADPEAQSWPEANRIYLIGGFINQEFPTSRR